MNTVILSTQLSSQAISGVGLLVFLFLLCFIIVHFFVLAWLGWNTQKENAPPPPSEQKKEEKPTPERKSEPIYYIVERKRAKSRPKNSYSEPKEIRFK